jgi:serine protease Do
MSTPRHQWIITGLPASTGLVVGLLIVTPFELPTDIPSSGAQSVVAATPLPGFALPAPHPLDPKGAQSGSATNLANINHALQVFSQVADKVIPVVVSIATTKIIPASEFDRSREQTGGSDFLGRDGIRLYQPRAYREQGSGSGIILTQDGYILTNVHVIAHATKLVVTLNDNRSFSGKVVGVDPLTEVAVVKIDARGLPAAVLGDSDKLVVGEWVMAVGNPLNLRSTVTAGIISAKGRDIDIIADSYGVENFIQTDAAINPGNSGGALVNLAGQVVGVNTAIATETGYGMGLGFAIPINLARKIAGDLIRYGKVARGYLGIALQEIGELQARALRLGTPRGVLVDEVYDGSPAQKGGLLPMDVILAIDGKIVQRINQIQTLVANKNPGAAINLRLIRDGREMEKRMTLGELQTNQTITAGRNEQNLFTQSSRSRFKTLGLEVETISEADAQRYGLAPNAGVLIARVEKFSPAEESGLRGDDIIVSVNRRAVATRENFLAELQKLKAGEIAILSVIRRGGRYHIFVEMP